MQQESYLETDEISDYFNIGTKQILNKGEKQCICEKSSKEIRSILNHDLKTPTLAQIRALDLLQSGTFGELNGDQIEIIEEIANSARDMLDLIKKTIKTYEYESKIVYLNYEQCNLYNISKECALKLATRATKKHQVINVLSTTNNSEVFVDLSQLKNIIEIFITTAICYGDKNSIVQTVIEKTRDSLVFSAISESKKIKKSVIDELFNKDTSNYSKYEKIGQSTNLYLAKKIAMAHNGSVFAHSSENQAIFGFTLPIACKTKELLQKK